MVSGIVFPHTHTHAHTRSCLNLSEICGLGYATRALWFVCVGSLRLETRVVSRCASQSCLLSVLMLVPLVVSAVMMVVRLCGLLSGHRLCRRYGPLVDKSMWNFLEEIVLGTHRS